MNTTALPLRRVHTTFNEDLRASSSPHFKADCVSCRADANVYISIKHIYHPMANTASNT
jgi:hypothetical protein